MIAGPTSSGKTWFTKNFLKHLDVMSDVHFTRILFYYSEWQPAYKDLGSVVEFHEGLPKHADYSDDVQPKLLILDDLMREANGNTVANLFTKGSHHRNLSIIFITQNLFHQGQREISLNSNYIVVFKNPRDRSQIRYLARQIYPECPQFLQESYLDATRKPHSYLLLDLRQDTPENCRLRTCIFPFDEHQFVYVPKNPIKSGAGMSDVPVVRV